MNKRNLLVGSLIIIFSDVGEYLSDYINDDSG